MMKVLHKREIELLKKYFEHEPSVSLAFLFGSQAQGLQHAGSDWDIGVYFKPSKGSLEWEEVKFYSEEADIWRKIEKIVKKEVDMVVINRVPVSLVFSILNRGFPLVIKDRAIFLDLLLQTSSSAIDFREFVFDFWRIKKRAKSLSNEDKFRLLKIVDFLEDEIREFNKFKKLSWLEYQNAPDKRRNIERWIENIVNSSLDIAKIILAGEKSRIPDTYKETLFYFGTQYFSQTFGENLSEFAKLRNIIAHQYLDIKWERIRNFIEQGQKLFPPFVKKIKGFIGD